MNTERTIEERPISELKPHPQQARLFHNLPKAEIRDLADNLSKNGLIHEVEILPDGTIICGHQRVGAAKRLGWKTIRCWVRNDLVEAGEAAIECRLIEDNLNRRHLSKLDKARSYVRLKALHEQPGIDVRDVVGKRLGMSGRNLDRWAKVLSTPLEVQQAVDRGQLTMADAGKIADLSAADQRVLAKEIVHGGRVKELLAERIANRKGKHASSVTWIQTILRGLEKIKNQTDQRLESHDQDAKPFDEALKAVRQIEKCLRTKQAEWQATRERQGVFIAAANEIKRG